MGGGASYKSWGPETYLLPARINPFHLLNQICFWVEFPWYFEKVLSFHVAFCCHHLIGIWYLHTKEPHIFGCFQKWWYQKKMDGFYNGKPTNKSMDDFTHYFRKTLLTTFGPAELASRICELVSSFGHLDIHFPKGGCWLFDSEKVVLYKNSGFGRLLQDQKDKFTLVNLFFCLEICPSYAPIQRRPVENLQLSPYLHRLPCRTGRFDVWQQSQGNNPLYKVPSVHREVNRPGTKSTCSPMDARKDQNSNPIWISNRGLNSTTLFGSLWLV